MIRPNESSILQTDSPQTQRRRPLGRPGRVIALPTQLAESKGGAEGGTRTPTLLRAPAPQAGTSERRSQPTPENRGRLFLIGTQPRWVEAVRCRLPCKFLRGRSVARPSISSAREGVFHAPARGASLREHPCAGAGSRGWIQPWADFRSDAMTPKGPRCHAAIGGERLDVRRTEGGRSGAATAAK